MHYPSFSLLKRKKFKILMMQKLILEETTEKAIRDMRKPHVAEK